MESGFKVGDKVQIRPGTCNSRWLWTNKLNTWARERTVLNVVEIVWADCVRVEANGVVQRIEPKSLRHVVWSAIGPALSPGDSVRIKSDYSGFLCRSIAEQDWKPDGTVLKFQGRTELPHGYCDVEGLDRATGGRVDQTIPFDSLELAPEPDAGSPLSPGDKVRIKPDYSGFLCSSIAEQKWKPESAVLEFKNCSIDGGLAVVGGSDEFFSGLITQAVPADSIELIPTESDSATPARKTEALANLEQGAIFSDGGDDLCMKTDESDDDIGYKTLYRCVVLTGEHIGLIVYKSADKEVTLYPNAAVVLEPNSGSETGSSRDFESKMVDPWDLAETQYGELEPGDVFRRDRGDGHDNRCFVVALKDCSDDYRFIDEDGDLLMGLFDETEVYRDDVLTDHGL